MSAIRKYQARVRRPFRRSARLSCSRNSPVRVRASALVQCRASFRIHLARCLFPPLVGTIADKPHGRNLGPRSRRRRAVCAVENTSLLLNAQMERRAKPSSAACAATCGKYRLEHVRKMVPRAADEITILVGVLLLGRTARGGLRRPRSTSVFWAPIFAGH